MSSYRGKHACPRRTHSAVNGILTDKTVLVIGRGSGIARAVTEAARAAGANVIVAGRDQEKPAGAYDDPEITTETVDVTDDASVEALAGRLNGLDHVVCTASARARGTLAELDRAKVQLSFDTKVTGPLVLARHLGPRLNPGGSFVIFSGAAAFKIQVGTLAVAITNGAADTLTRSLAVELAPIRVNAISPGIIDTGAWDGLGEEARRGCTRMPPTRSRRGASARARTSPTRSCSA